MPIVAFSKETCVQYNIFRSARLNAIPQDVSFFITPYGDFTRNQLIEEVEKGTDVGKAATEMELNFLRKLPLLAKMVK